MGFLRIMLVAALLGIVLPLPATAVEAGHALSFDGTNDLVSLANAGYMMGPDWENTKTISLWVKPVGPSVACAYSSPAKCDLIFGDRPEWWGIVRGSIDGQDRIWLWNYDDGYDRVGISYTAGEWVHITMVHSGGILHAYRNGVEVGSVVSGPTDQPPPPALPVLHLGGMIFSSSRVYTYEGLLDEVQVWNVVRSTAEIQQDMYSILEEDEPGLAAYYRMSNGAGLTLTDDSINNWNGILRDGGDGVPPDGAPPQWVLSDVFPSDNKYPTTADDAATTTEDAPVTLPVLANDSDPDGDVLTVIAAGPPAHGTATTNGVTVTYTPSTDFYGADSFSYRISDGAGNTATAQVNITVTPVSDSPVAVGDAATTVENEAVIVPVLANDSDPDGDALTVIAAGSAAHGTTTTNGVTVTYTPNTDFFGTDSFSYRISDGSGRTAPAQVNITVTPVGDPPVAVDDAVSTAEDAAVMIPVLANDSDPDGDALTVTAAGSAAHGTATTDGVTVTYTPNTDFFGTDSLLYTISDGAGYTATAQVNITVTPVNDDPPVAVDDASSTAEDAAVIIPVLANDSDPDGDLLTVTAAGPAAHGTATTNGITVAYTPNTDFHGADSFLYTISDGSGRTATAQVSITVTPVGDSPVAVDDAVSTAEDATVTLPVLANDSDPDGDALTVTAAGPAAHGAVTTDGATITYAPVRDFFGTDSFSYTIDDGSGGAATAQVNITVTPVNDDPPVAVDDPATTAEDDAVTVLALANDRDPDGDPLTVTAAGPATHGAVTTDGATITYAPVRDFFGTDSFSYAIDDGSGGAATAQVNITVTPVNDSPIAVDDAATTAKDAMVIVPVLGNDSDPDGDLLTVTAAGPATHGAVTTDGVTITYAPNANFYGADSFPYTISDGHDRNATALLSITITKGVSVLYLPFISER